MKLPKYYEIVYLLFLRSKARQAKMEHMEMKISQPIFGILVDLTKNEVTKICNEPGKYISFSTCLHSQSEIQWNLVIVNFVLSPFFFTSERFLLLQDSMIFIFKNYNNPYCILYLTVFLLYNTGTPVTFKTWWGHQYYGGHNLPPPLEGIGLPPPWKE